jgi:hypothetical protein
LLGCAPTADGAPNAGVLPNPPIEEVAPNAG